MRLSPGEPHNGGARAEGIPQLWLLGLSWAFLLTVKRDTLLRAHTSYRVDSSPVSQLFHGPTPRSPLNRLSIRLRLSRSNTSTEKAPCRNHSSPFSPQGTGRDFDLPRHRLFHYSGIIPIPHAIPISLWCFNIVLVRGPARPVHGPVREPCAFTMRKEGLCAEFDPRGKSSIDHRITRLTRAFFTCHPPKKSQNGLVPVEYRPRPADRPIPPAYPAPKSGEMTCSQTPQGVVTTASALP